MNTDKSGVADAVLVVDDDVLCRSVAGEVLSQFGVEVHAASDADEALRLAESIAFRFMFLDLNMPDIDGLELFKRLVASDPSARNRIAVLTADASGAVHRRLLDQGVLYVFTKPLDKDQLCRLFFSSPTEHTVSDVNPEGLRLQGIDEERGLANFMGSRAAFEKTLVYFPEYARQYVEDFEAALKEGRHADCKRLAHSLKGSSWMLGAVALRDAAKRLEQACARDASLATIKSRFEAVMVLIRDLSDSIESFFEAADEER